MGTIGLLGVEVGMLWTCLVDFGSRCLRRVTWWFGLENVIDVMLWFGLENVIDVMLWFSFCIWSELDIGVSVRYNTTSPISSRKYAGQLE